MPRGVYNRDGEWRKKISESICNKNNGNYGKRGKEAPAWKDDDVGYDGLHKHIRKALSKPVPFLCEVCGLVPAFQVACITHVYNRDLKNWKWACISCNNTKYQLGFKCIECGIIRMSLYEKFAYERCNKCYLRLMRSNKKTILLA